MINLIRAVLLSFFVSALHFHPLILALIIWAWVGYWLYLLSNEAAYYRYEYVNTSDKWKSFWFSFFLPVGIVRSFYNRTIRGYIFRDFRKILGETDNIKIKFQSPITFIKKDAKTENK